MEQHDLSLTHGFARDQRGAIAKRGDHPVGQSGVGLRHDLGRNGHVIGHRQPKERRPVAERGQRLGLAPRHRAADAATPGAQAHGHQRVFVDAADIARRHARPGETDEHAARVDPLLQRLGLSRGEGGHIRQHDHIGVGGQHLGQGAVDQISTRGQRLFDVMQR